MAPFSITPQSQGDGGVGGDPDAAAAEEGSTVDESVEESFPASDPASPFAHGNGHAGQPPAAFDI
jgi:aconitate hydratase